MCARVVAVDVSPVMLERLRAKVAASALVNVEAVQAGFLTYEHQGPAVDFVYSCWALHHLADFWKALALHRMRAIPPWRLEPMMERARFRIEDATYSADGILAEYVARAV